MSKWSVECVIKFLIIYQKHECLWNPQNKNYKQKNAKDSALNEIVKELGIPGLAPCDIKLKIKSIRTAYKRELSAVLKSSKDNENSRKYIPKLFWFKLADSFLRPISMKRQSLQRVSRKKTVANNFKTDSPCKVETTFNIGSASEQSQENIVICNENEEFNSNEEEIGKDQIALNSYKIHSNEDGEMVVTTVTPQNPHHDIHIESIQCTNEICNSNPNNINPATETTIIDRHGNITTTTAVQTTQNIQIENNTTDINHHRVEDNLPQQSRVFSRLIDEDDYFIFGRSVAAQLRSVPDSYSRSVAKFKIQQILFEAEIGQYKK